MSEIGRATFAVRNQGIAAKIMDAENIQKREKNICPKAPDGKHRYKMAGAQHAMMNHCDYECVYCGHQRCVNLTPPELKPETLPTDEDLDKEGVIT